MTITALAAPDPYDEHTYPLLCAGEFTCSSGGADTMNTKPRRLGEDYTTSQGLRSLLTRLHEAEPGAWEHDPAAQELMTFAAEKYAALARKHGEGDRKSTRLNSSHASTYTLPLHDALPISPARQEVPTP